MENLSDLEKLAQNPAQLEKHLTQAVDTAMAVITTYGLKMIGAIVILVIGWTISGMVHKAIIKAGQRTHRIDVTIFTFMASLAKYAVLVFTVVAMLSSFGVETTSFVAVLGAMGLAIGLALQGTLSHVAAGLMLIIFRPFRLGDAIEAAGVAGNVVEISLFTTEIYTADNVKIIIPNSAIWAGVIKNLSEHERRKIVIEVGVSYAADVDAVLAMVREVVESDERVRKDPAPIVVVSRFTDAAVMVMVEAWVANADLAPVRFDLNRKIKDIFARNDVSLPAPARVSQFAPLPQSAPPPPTPKT
jgi:small conductance mechanosensitive channel